MTIDVFNHLADRVPVLGRSCYERKVQHRLRVIVTAVAVNIVVNNALADAQSLIGLCIVDIPDREVVGQSH